MRTSIPRKRTFVGFGFGPIQAGLFLYEAMRSEAFSRLVVAEVVPELVEAVQRGGHSARVNIAHFNRVEQVSVQPIEILCPSTPAGRDGLVRAVAEAEEIATAVPSVQYYRSDSPGSLHRILAEGLLLKLKSNQPRAIVYAAENHNHAAELLHSAVIDEIPQGDRGRVNDRVRFVNTVIGKMSGTVSDPDELRGRGLAPIAPGLQRAVLVEEFNRILISRVQFEDQPPFERGIGVFTEKDDLLPFEEAKLYGHNATHALAAYLGAMRGIRRVCELREFPDMLGMVRTAFIEESGEALIRKHAGVDPLFTPAGYAEYADDLIARMINPFLGDTVARVGRDPERKLGWDDRLVGTMRVALSVNVQPQRYAAGSAAALALLDPTVLDQPSRSAAILQKIWSGGGLREERETQAVLSLIEEGCRRLRRWIDLGYPPLPTIAPEDLGDIRQVG